MGIPSDQGPMEAARPRYRFSDVSPNMVGSGLQIAPTPERPSFKSPAIPWMGPLSRLNVLLGANNSGKSRVLRDLFANWERAKVRMAGLRPNPNLVVEASKLVRPYAQWLETPSSGPTVGQITSHLAKFIDRVERQLPLVGDPAYFDQMQTELSSIWLELFSIVRTLYDRAGKSDAEQSGSISAVRELREAIGDATSRSMTRVYIPTLRATRAFEREWNSQDRIGEAVMRQYFDELRVDREEGRVLQQHLHVLTGQDFYVRIRRHLLGTLQEREMIAGLQTYLGKQFFEGAPVALIPKEVGSHNNESHTLYIKIGDEQEQPVHQLGDGVSQLIVMLYPLFRFRDQDLLLFIEEPENYLHPGFQRKLIDAFIQPPNRGGVPVVGRGSRQVFVATHSHQFLDLTLESDDVSVFHVKKETPNDDVKERLPTIVIETRSTGHHPLLRELGVRNSSVLLANCTIWVEGPTDRMYLRHYLKLVLASLKGSKLPQEDIHYTIAEYAGSNIEHWCFASDAESSAGALEAKIRVDRLCGKAMVIADKDSTVKGGKDGKSLRLEKLEQQLGDDFIRLRVREIENLIAAPVLRKAVAKWQNWAPGEEKFKKFEDKAYGKVYLGEFITSKVLGEGVKPKKQFRATKGTGTILHKAEFAKCVMDCTLTAEDLSPEARRIVDQMIAFIDKHNQ